MTFVTGCQVNLLVAVINPTQRRDSDKAEATLAKTERIDAAAGPNSRAVPRGESVAT